MPLLPASSSVRVQWKNGLASTLVVASDASAVGDASAAGDDWSWRLSIADVPSRSEFSTFPGVERSIAILHGDALTLERAGVRTAVTREGIALVFAGEEFVVGDPIGTDVRDVNWMVRRDRWRGEMQLIRARETQVDAPLVVVHAGVGGVEILSCDEAIGAQLACGETLVTRDRVHLRVAEGCCAIVCTAHPRATEQSASNPPTLRDVVRAFGYIGWLLQRTMGGVVAVQGMLSGLKAAVVAIAVRPRWARPISILCPNFDLNGHFFRVRCFWSPI